MKIRILLLSSMLFCLSALGQNQITTLVTITNNPTADQTLIVNGTTVTWKSSAGTPATQIQTAAAIGGAFTNLVRYLRTYPIPNTSSLEVPGSTNAIKIYGISGASMSAAAAGWATITYSTNRTVSQIKDHVVVADLESMQALRPSITRSVTIQYHTTLGDGGGGTFIASSDSLTDNGGTIIASESEAGWYWVRQYTGDVFPEWWGANGSDAGDDSAAFNEALANFKDISLLPNKLYKIDVTITGQDYKLSVAGGTTKIQSFSTNQFAITVGDNSVATGGIKISNIEFHGGLTNYHGLKVRGGVDGLTLRDCEFSRFKGNGLHILGESTSIKNIRIVGGTFTQGVEADDDLIQIDQSSSNNVIGVSFTDCQGTSNEDDNNLLQIDSVEVTMSNCRWDVGTAGAKVRLNKSQTTPPIIYGGQSTIASQTGTAAIKIGFTPGSTAVGTLVPNTIITGNLEYVDSSTTTWTGMAQPQFSSLNFLTASPEGALTSLTGSLAPANISGIPQLYIKGKTASLNAANWVSIMRDRYVDAYGAVGDATTDDTAAIEAAMALGGRIVFTAGKIYRITDTLDFTVSDTHLYFEEGSEILMDGNDMAILCDAILDNISVVNGTIRMNGGKGFNNTGIITINKTRSFYLKGCINIATNSALDGAGLGINGFSTSQGASGIFEDCVAMGTTKSGYHISTGSEFITLRNCIATNNINTNTGSFGHTPGFDTSGTFIRFENCRAYNTGGPGFLLSADGNVDPGTNSCADNILIQNCETWNPGVASSSAEGWGLAIRSSFPQWPTNIVVNGLKIYNPYNAALKLEKGEYFDISNVQAYNVRFLGITGVSDVRNVRLNNIYLDGDETQLALPNRAIFTSGGTNWVFNTLEIKDFGRGFDHVSGTPMNDVSISNFKYSNVTTPYLFNSTHFITNGHWSLRGPWVAPNDSTHNAAPDGSVWFNTTAGAATAFYVKVNGTWTAK